MVIFKSHNRVQLEPLTGRRNVTQLDTAGWRPKRLAQAPPAAVHTRRAPAGAYEDTIVVVEGGATQRHLYRERCRCVAPPLDPTAASSEAPLGAVLVCTGAGSACARRLGRHPASQVESRSAGRPSTSRRSEINLSVSGPPPGRSEGLGGRGPKTKTHVFPLETARNRPKPTPHPTPSRAAHPAPSIHRARKQR